MKQPEAAGNTAQTGEALATLPDQCVDLTEAGFTQDDIRTMFYAREYLMRDVIDAAASLNARNRLLALALIQTIAAINPSDTPDQPEERMAA